MLNKLFFSFRFAFRNITRNILNSILVFFTIFIISVLTLLLFNFSKIVDKKLYSDSLNEYPNCDIVITPNYNLNEYLLDTKKLRPLALDLDISYYEFQISTAIETKNTTDTDDKVFNFIGIDYEEYNKITEDSLGYLAQRDCAVNETFLIEQGLEVGDNIDVLISDTVLTYKIKYVLKDSGFNSSRNIYVQRNELIKIYSKELLGVDLQVATNVYLASKIILGLKDSSKKEELIQTLSSLDYYPSSTVKDAYDHSEMDAYYKDVYAIVYACYGFFTVALAYIVISTIIIRIERSKNVIGIVKSFGANNYYYFVLLLEMIIYSILSLGLGVLVSNIAYNIYFNNRVSIIIDYNYSLLSILSALLIPVVLSFLAILVSYKSYKNISIVSLSKEKNKYRRKSLVTFLLLISILAFSSSLLFLLKNKMKVDLYYFIQLLIMIELSLLSIPFIISLISKLFKNKSLFSYINLNLLKNSRLKLVSIIIICVSFFGSILVLSIFDNMKAKVNRAVSNGNIDYVLANVSDSKGKEIDKISALDGVNKANKAIYKTYVSDSLNIFTFYTFVSFDVDDFYYYYNTNIDSKIKEEFKDKDTSYCVIPNDRLKKEEYVIGDTISIVIGSKSYDYTILGGIDIGTAFFIFTNDYYTNRFESNSIVIDFDYENESLKNDFKEIMFKNYGPKLSILIDHREKMHEQVDRTLQSLNLVYFCLILLVIAFALSIFNNTIVSFMYEKNTYVKLASLGCSNKTIYSLFIKEILLSLLIQLIPTAFTLFIGYKWFGYLSMLFGSYTELKFDLDIFIWSIVGNICVYFVSNIYYFIGFKNANIAQEIKQ